MSDARKTRYVSPRFGARARPRQGEGEAAPLFTAPAADPCAPLASDAEFELLTGSSPRPVPQGMAASLEPLDGDGPESSPSFSVPGLAPDASPPSPAAGLAPVLEEMGETDEAGRTKVDDPAPSFPREGSLPFKDADIAMEADQMSEILTPGSQDVPAGAASAPASAASPAPSAGNSGPDGLASKHDGGKCRLELLAPEMMFALGDVVTHGAAKYGDRDWERGMPWGKVFGAAMRHLWAHWRGEDIDADSGLPHVELAFCEIAFLVVYRRRRIGLDDRAVQAKG